MATVVDTALVPPRERFRLWERISAAADEPLAVRRAADTPFSIRMRWGAVGPLATIRMRADEHVAARTPATILAGDPQVIHLMLQVRGRCAVTQDGRASVSEPGQLVAWQSSSPYEIDALEPFEALIVNCPARLVPHAAAMRRRTAVALPATDGVGLLVAQHLTALHDDAEGAALGAEGRALLARSALELFQALYVAGGAPAIAAPRADLRRRVSDHIDAHLGDPTLGPASIAAALHVSRSYLHRLFAGDELGVRGTIRSRRLERCRRDLLDPALAAEPVARIATRWGFVSAAHFSRAFRAAYGQTPSEARRAAAAP